MSRRATGVDIKIRKTGEMKPPTRPACPPMDQGSKWLRFCLYFMVVGLPLLVLPWTRSTVEFPKTILLLGSVLILLVIWLALLMRQKISAMGLTAWDYSLIGLGGVLLLVALFSVERTTSFLGRDGLLVGSWWFWAALLLLAGLIPRIVNFRAALERLQAMLLVVMNIIWVVAILQFIGIISWQTALGGSANFTLAGNSIMVFGAISAAAVVLAVAYFSSASSKVANALGLISFILGVVTLLLIDLSSTWIGLIVGVVVWLAYVLARPQQFAAKRLWPAPLLLALAILFLFLNLADLLPLKISPELTLGQAVSIDIWKEAWQHRPILGTGLNTYLYAFSEYRPEMYNQTAVWGIRFDSASNGWWEMLVTLGVIGILAWAWAVFQGIRTALKAMARPGLLAAWAVLAVYLFLGPISTLYWVLFWFLLALAVAQGMGETKLSAPPKLAAASISTRKQLAVSFLFLLATLASVAGLYLLVRVYVAEIWYEQAQTLSSADNPDPEKVINTIERARALQPYSPAYYRDLSALWLVRARQEASNENPDVGTVRSDVAKALSLARQPVDTFAANSITDWQYLAGIYRDISAYAADAEDWAIDSYTQALTLDPLNPILFTQRGKIYVWQSDKISRAATAQLDSSDPSAAIPEETQNQIKDKLDAAVTDLTHAIDLRPDYLDALVSLAQTYDRQGDAGNAKEKILLARGYQPDNLQILYETGRIHYNAEDLVVAREAFTKVLKQDENHANALYSLGLLDIQEGKRADGLARLRKVQELNPNNEEIAELVKELTADAAAPETISGSPVTSSDSGVESSADTEVPIVP